MISIDLLFTYVEQQGQSHAWNNRTVSTISVKVTIGHHDSQANKNASIHTKCTAGTVEHVPLNGKKSSTINLNGIIYSFCRGIHCNTYLKLLSQRDKNKHICFFEGRAHPSVTFTPFFFNGRAFAIQFPKFNFQILDMHSS